MPCSDPAITVTFFEIFDGKRPLKVDLQSLKAISLKNHRVMDNKAICEPVFLKTTSKMLGKFFALMMGRSPDSHSAGA